MVEFSKVESQGKQHHRDEDHGSSGIAVEEEQLDKVFSIIKNACRERNDAANMQLSKDASEPKAAEIATGDAVIFVWDLDRMERF